VNAFRIMAALGISATLAACGQVHPPKGATPVHFTVLTKHGGLQSGIWAATSSDDLRSQEVQIGPTPLPTCTRKDETGCFAKFSTPAGSLLVALQPVACANNHVDTAYLKDGTLTFVVNWTNTCSIGERAAAIPDDWIVGVPLRELPQTSLPLKLAFSDGGKTPWVASSGLVDLRAQGPGLARSGDFSLDATPVVVKGEAEHIALTVFGIRAVYGPWRIDIAALDASGRVVWHQAPYDQPPTFKCVVTQRNTCTVWSYNVEMPTVGLTPGNYLIRPSFVLPAVTFVPPVPASSVPLYALPSLTVEVVAG
jgi:hypothetical protein